MLLELNDDARGDASSTFPVLEPLLSWKQRLSLLQTPQRCATDFLSVIAFMLVVLWIRNLQGRKCDFMLQGSRVMTSVGVDEDSQVLKAAFRRPLCYIMARVCFPLGAPIGPLLKTQHLYSTLSSDIP